MTITFIDRYCRSTSGFQFIERAIDAPDAAFTTKYRQRIEHAKPGGCASYGDSQRVNDIADLNSLRLAKVI